METGKYGFVEYPIDRFFGTQGMYYTPSVAIKLGHFLRNDNYEPGHDVRMHQFCKDEKIKVYVPNRIVIQHIGEKSAFHNITIKRNSPPDCDFPIPDYLYPSYDIPHFHTSKKYVHQELIDEQLK